MKPGIGTILVSLLGGVLLAVAVGWHCIRAGPVARGEREFVAARTESGSIRQFVLLDTASRFGVEEIAFTATDSGAWHRLGLQVRDEAPDTPSWARWPAEPDLTTGQTRLHVAAGWPMICLVGDCTETDDRWSLTDEEIGERDQRLQVLRALQGRVAQMAPQMAPQMAQQMAQQVARLQRSWARVPPRWRHAIVLKDQQQDGPFTAVVLPYHVVPVGLAANTLFYALPVAAIILGGRAFLRAILCLARRWRGKCPRCAYQLRGTTVHGCPECGWRKASCSD